ncbi:hypothetical protein RSAG8_00865, partial [Rhizoctonia solani AG-8 WAC10335]
MDDDRAQIDELEEDLNESLQYPPDSDPHIHGEQVNGEPRPAENPQLAERAHARSDITPAGLDQTVSIEEPSQPAEEPPQTDMETNSLVSKTDAILRAETLGITAATEKTDFSSLEEQDTLELSEVEDLGFSVPLTEQEISVIAQNFVLEVEEMSTEPSEPQSSEQDSNQPDLQAVEPEPMVTPEPVVDSHEGAGAPPLRRMDDDTIPVTAHSKESIIEVLNASSSTADESIQPTTTTEQVLQESKTVVTTQVVPEQVDMVLDTQDTVQPEEPTSASVMAHVEYIQALEPSKEGEGEDIVVEPVQVAVEQNGEPNIDATVEASIDHQPIQIIEDEPNPAVQVESTTLDPTLDGLTTASGDAAGPIVTVIEQSTTIAEQTSAQETEQPEPSAVDSVPEAIMETTATSITTTVISTDPDVADLVISVTGAGDIETDPVERAAQIQQEQDGTAQTTEDETQATLVAESVATVNNTVVTDEIPDLTAPKDSGSPSRRAPSQSQSQLDTVAPQTTGPIDSLVTQDEEPDIPEESSEPTKAQYQVSPDAPEAISGTGPFNRQTPEWEGFAALDEEDAPGSPEPEPSSEPSEHPDVLTEDSPLNATSASTDKAKEPKQPSNSSTAPTRKQKKPRMIMEVIIPVAHGKPKVAQETKPIKKRGRPAKATKSAKAPAPSEPEPVAASSSSPQRRSSSAGTSSIKSQPSEPEPEPTSRMKKPVMKRPGPSSSRKRVKAMASGSSTRPVHVAHAAKLEVVIPRRPRPSVLKTIGGASSGKNVKFTSVSPVTGKRKAESEPEVDEEGSDADADGETDEDYEDVEEESGVKAEAVISPKPRKKMRTTTKAKKTSPIKRPHRSREARKAPAKLPEIVSKGSRSPPKRRRLRR